MIKSFWKWVTKHRHSEEGCGVLIKYGRWHNHYKCCETGEDFTYPRAMGTVEDMLAFDDDKRDRLERLQQKEGGD